jgi:uncharacterized damage-inducible protein DinB
MNTFLKSISEILSRDLDNLQKEIEQYPTEESVWVIKSEIKNSAGTLVLHLCGNLQHYIGVGLGNSGYKRDRDKEFSARNVSRAELIKEIGNARAAVKLTLEKVSSEILETEYPLPVFDYPMTVQHFMIHLVSHFGYHLGQVNYHRRLTA